MLYPEIYSAEYISDFLFSALLAVHIIKFKEVIQPHLPVGLPSHKTAARDMDWIIP